MGTAVTVRPRVTDFNRNGEVIAIRMLREITRALSNPVREGSSGEGFHYFEGSTPVNYTICSSPVTSRDLPGQEMFRLGLSQTGPGTPGKANAESADSPALLSFTPFDFNELLETVAQKAGLQTQIGFEGSPFANGKQGKMLLTGRNGAHTQIGDSNDPDVKFSIGNVAYFHDRADAAKFLKAGLDLLQEMRGQGSQQLENKRGLLR